MNEGTPAGHTVHAMPTFEAHAAATHPHLRSYESVSETDRQLVGGKGLHSALMAQRGIAVPEGFCVTTDAHDTFLRTGEVDTSLVGHIEDFRNTVGGRIAIRSSATCEDGSDVSLAGVFDTHYLDDEGDVSSAIAAIYGQSRSDEVRGLLELHNYQPEHVKMGLVVQRLIAADQSGVLYTGVNNDSMLAQYVEGFGADLVDGVQEGSSLLIDGAGVITQSKG